MKNLLLILASMCFLMILGSATYEHLAVIPVWSSGPPASLHLFQGDHALQSQFFWIPIHPVTILLMVGALIVNWNTPRRKNILTVLVGYVVILITTYVYFVPALIGFMETPYQDAVDESLTKRAAMWELLSTIRLILIAVLSYILLGSLTKSNETVVVPEATAVPLSYQNDALGG